MKTYAIADIHGRFDLLDRARNKIKEVSEEEDMIVFLGDYIDRGPDSRKVIEHLMEASKDPRIVCLKGNHEDIMVQTIVNKLAPDWWVGNGGGNTLLSYGHPDVTWMEDVSYAYVPEDHLKWLNSLPLFYQTDRQVFVHAGIPQFGMNLPAKSDRNTEKMMWMLYGKQDRGGWRGKHVIHGHHQFEDGPHTWLDAEKGGRTDLDCWAYHTGRLVVGVYDNTQLHAIDYIEVKETD